MRVVSLSAVHARTRMKHAFKHASHERRENDALLIRCELDSGDVGWGEGLPRPYVTGETIESAWRQLDETFASERLDADVRSLSDVVSLLRGWRLAGDDGSTFAERGCFGNAARCAVELAVLDAVGRATETPLHRLPSLIEGADSVAASHAEVRYGLVISPSTVRKALKRAAMARLYGFPDLKLKLGIGDHNEAKNIVWLRRLLGHSFPMRTDINEAWSAGEIEAKLDSLGRAAWTLESIEQPCRHDEIKQTAELVDRVPPIVLDESLCSMGDAERAVEHGYGPIFNLRVSKCGGLIPAIELAQFANANGREYQMGCQVGETGILSAAGRALACGVAAIRRLEGSFDRHLVEEPLTKQDLTFGRGGRAPRLDAGGLGVDVDESAVERIAVQSRVWSW